MAAAVELSLVGCRVRLTAAEGQYVGTVRAVGERDGSVSLAAVTFDCGGRPEAVHGLQKFLRGDVRAVEVLEAAPDAPAPAPSVARAAPARRDRAVMEAPTRRRPLYSQRLLDDGLLLARVAADDSDDSDVAGGDAAPAAAPRADSPPPLLARPSGFALIDSAGDELAAAADFLLGQDTVGVAAEGQLVGRTGRLALLTVACAQFVFVFDVIACGAPAVAALRPLLEAAAVRKVVHDCRALADLLAHQHRIRPANVFDTQAAEAYLYRQRSGAVPTFVSDVAHTLVTRLGLLPRQVFFPRYRLDRLREDQEVWLKRPLSEALLEGAVKNAVYLRELQHVQEQAMFSTFSRCVDEYLAAVRDGDDEDAANAPHERHRLPVRVQSILEERPAGDHRPQSVNNVLHGADDRLSFTRNVWYTSGTSGRR